MCAMARAQNWGLRAQPRRQKQANVRECPTFTETTCLSVTPDTLHVFGRHMYMPFCDDNALVGVTSPHGPTSLRRECPAMSPGFRAPALRFRECARRSLKPRPDPRNAPAPKLKHLLSGFSARPPSTLLTRIGRGLAEILLFGERGTFLPNKISTCSAVKWTWRARCLDQYLYCPFL